MFLLTFPCFCLHKSMSFLRAPFPDKEETKGFYLSNLYVASYADAGVLEEKRRQRREKSVVKDDEGKI